MAGGGGGSCQGCPPSFKPWGPQLIRQEQELHFQSSIKPEPPPRPPFLGFMALCGNESLCHQSREQQGDTRMLPRDGGSSEFHSKAKLVSLGLILFGGTPPSFFHCKSDGGPREACAPCRSSGSRASSCYFFLQMLGLNGPSAPVSPVPICLAGENAIGACQVWAERIYFFNLSVPSACTFSPCSVNSAGASASCFMSAHCRLWRALGG